MQSAELVRRLGPASAAALVVSNMVGTGIFGTSGFLAGDLGSPGILLAIWLAGGLVALAGSVCYAELGINFQRSGGEYVYLTERYGPAWGFINGWVSFTAGFSAPIAVTCLAMVSYLAYFNPSLDPQNEEAARIALGPLTINLGPGALIGCGVIVALTALNLIGVGVASRVQNALTVLKLTVLGALLVLGFAVGNGDWSHFSQATERTSSLGLSAQFFISLVFVYWAYSGWNAAVYVAEEVREPEKTLPQAMIAGAIFVTFFYIALNSLFIYATPLDEMKGVVAVGAQAAGSLFGEAGGRFFALAMAASLMATINAMCLVGPRVYYAMAQNKAFFPAAAKVHPTWKTPYVAILAQGAFTIVLILTGTFESLGNYIGFTLWLFSSLSVFAVFQFRSRPGWKRLPAVSFAWPLIPAFYTSANALIFLYFAWGKSWEAMWTLLTIAAGAFAYSRLRAR
jgi:APA family basic amino acid/polyamine antiporter